MRFAANERRAREFGSHVYRKTAVAIGSKKFFGFLFEAESFGHIGGKLVSDTIGLMCAEAGSIDSSPQGSF